MECRDQEGGKEVWCTKYSRYRHEAPNCRITKGVVGFLTIRRKPMYKVEKIIPVKEQIAKEMTTIQEEGYRVKPQEEKKEVIEDKTIDEKMQVIYIKVGGSLVSTLPDTGCSTICVNSNLVKDDQLTGETNTFTGKRQQANRQQATGNRQKWQGFMYTLHT